VIDHQRFGSNPFSDIQKISKRDWLCKTSEDELAMLNQPGVPPQIFNVSVRDEGVAQNILKYAGDRVNLT
jgi:hypothetical protein